MQELPKDAGPRARPIVAIVGRPNVGKSTLFNRLVGASRAIVDDRPGVTRDRSYADTDAFGTPYVLVDTGGFDPEDPDPLPSGIRVQVQLAVDEAALVLCVLDAREGPSPTDRLAVQLLRESGRPTIYLANKSDTAALEAAAGALHELGVPQIRHVSAEHGRGVGDLVEAIAAALPEPEPEPEPESVDVVRVAIVGRPNAGKSSLVNRLLGTERMLVDARPGTTRDAVDSLLVRGRRRYRLVDTAGIRRRRAVERGAEQYAVFHAIRALERADVAVLLVDATGTVADQDLRILGLATDRGTGVLIGLSKWDLLERGRQSAKEVLEKAREAIPFASYVPLVPLSSESGRGTRRLLEMVDRIAAARRQRIPTARLNRFFATVLEHTPPPTSRGRSVRFYYFTQASVAPPTFVVQANTPQIRDHYRRYVERSLRTAFGFEGVPIRVFYRARRRKERR